MNENVLAREAILGKREELILAHKFELLKIFDTFQKTSETKDVVLVQNKQGEKRIIRIGETRPSVFFPDGYKGEYMYVPRIFDIETAGVPYEIEEYIEGNMACDLTRDTIQKGEIKIELLQVLIHAFWEFQTVGTRNSLEPMVTTDKIKKHFEKAKDFLPDPNEILHIIAEHTEFLTAHYPSKWKYALDNLIITHEGKVCFIDNVNVGLRYFGYDLGWLIWPQWLHMTTDYYESHLGDYMDYLVLFKELIKAQKPKSFEYSSSFIDQAFWFVVLERIIGSLYDVGNKTRHLAHCGINDQEGKDRRDKHVQFLLKLLKEIKSNLFT